MTDNASQNTTLAGDGHGLAEQPDRPLAAAELAAAVTEETMRDNTRRAFESDWRT
jgi:hypothetical protein